MSSNSNDIETRRLTTEELSVRRKLKREWRTRVKAMAPEMVNTFEQKCEPTFGSFPPEIQELLYADIRSLIWAYISPFAATDEELMAIGADITVKGLTVAIEADALLGSGGFYLRRFRISVGSHNEWTDFLMDARCDKGFNVLNNAIFTLTKIPVTLLMEVMPFDETLRDAYLRQNHEVFGNVMAAAAAGDIHNSSQWRLEALWQLAPEMCRTLAVSPFRNRCPLHHSICQSTLKPDLDLDSFYETLLKLLPAEELGYDEDTVKAFSIPLMNGTGVCSVMNWAKDRTRECAHREGILSALREALVL